MAKRRLQAAVAAEMATVLDRYNPKAGFVDGWRAWTLSTLAVVQVREQLKGFSVPSFKKEAASIFCGVGTALASADHRKLRTLTTPMCYATMSGSLSQRPAGEQHLWEALDVTASLKQVRVGHHKSSPDHRFAQITCAVNAKLIWSIRDAHGQAIGGVGTAEEPFDLSDYWVFERCITGDAAGDAHSWRLKARIEGAATKPVAGG